MPDSLSKRLSRRKFLLSSGGMAMFTAIATSSLALPNHVEAADDTLPASSQDQSPPQAIEVLYHDEVQEGAAFARGKLLYTAALTGGLLRGPGVFESEVIAAPFPFTHAVLGWRSELATFEFRTSVDGLTWPDWRWSYLDGGASVEFGDAEGFSSLAGVPRHRFLQYRARLADGASISRVNAIFLNAKDGPATGVAVTPEASKPAAIDFSRAEWGCDERSRFDGTQETAPPRFVAVSKLVIHHTATPENYDDAIAEVRALYTYHAKIFGWGDIGYHVLIDHAGRSYEGHYGRVGADGREVFSSDVVGAHASGYNFGTCSVALIGQFQGEGAQPVSKAMLDKLVDVLEYRARQSQIDPQGVSDFLLSTGEWNPGMPNIVGHRDCNTTSCPGHNLYSFIGEVRQRLAARLAMQPAPAIQVRQGARTGDVSFVWTASPGYEYSYSLQGWSGQDENITYLAGYTRDLNAAWSDWTTSSSASYSGLSAGHWQLQVRARNAAGPTYKATQSVLIA